MPPGNTPPGIPGTHQPNQVNQPNQINQPNQMNQANLLSQPNQIIQPNQTNQPNQITQPNQINQQNRKLPPQNLSQLNISQQSSLLQSQTLHLQQKQQGRNIPTNPVSQSINPAVIAAVLNLNPSNQQNADINKFFQQLKKMNFLPSMLQIQQNQNQNFQQQRPKQPLQHINLSQIHGTAATLSSSASTPTLSSLPFGSVQTGGLNPPQQNQTILTPRQPPSTSKKQKESPKVEVNVTTQSLAHCIESCGLSNSFLQEIDRFEITNNVKISPKSITSIAIALYTRMNQIVEQSVKNCHIRLSSNLYINEHQNFMEEKKKIEAEANLAPQQKQAQLNLQQEFQKRALSLLPGEPVFTDVPMANIAQIEVERRIAESGILNYPEPPKGIDNTFDVFRNHTLCGIAARVPENMREKITSCTKEMPDNAQPDYSSIARLGFVQTDKKLEVTFEDVYQVIENDVMFTPQKLQSSEFSLQIRKIKNMQLRKENGF